MSRHRLLSAVLALGVGCLPLPGTADARAGDGPAGKAVSAYLRGTRIACYAATGEGMCPIARIASATHVHYGTLAGVQSAVAFVDYRYDATGNAMDMMAVVFREEGGTWVPVGRAEGIQGSAPRDVRFEGTSIAYTGTMLGGGDARANPSASRRFRLVVGPRKVAFVAGGTGR